MQHPSLRSLTAHRIGIVAVCAAVMCGALPSAVAEDRLPNVVLLTIDTLRADRMSGYGYARPTSPNLDQMMRDGVRFARARTVEPLTGPGMVAMLTSTHPHENGASRNGMRMRPGLDSLPALLRRHGYRTAAFVSNWTLRDKLTGLGEHFDHYDEVLERKRWLGLISSEARADDVNERVLRWAAEHVETAPERPFFVWVHYVEPHAPYEAQRDYLDRLGLGGGKHGKLSKSDRYDTEVADADRAAGELFEALERIVPPARTMTVFAADHGESLGEHGYWGHGRNLHEPGLLVPMAIAWPGRLGPRTIDAPALITDIPPTVASLIGLESPPGFGGHDWTAVIHGADPPVGRVTRYQAHKGAVLSGHDSDLARRAGLLEVAVIRDGQKEILRVKSGRHQRFDLRRDPAELADRTESPSGPTDGLQDWVDVVFSGLEASDVVPASPLDEETQARLRALGYVD